MVSIICGMPVSPDSMKWPMRIGPAPFSWRGLFRNDHGAGDRETPKREVKWLLPDRFGTANSKNRETRPSPAICQVNYISPKKTYRRRQ